MAIPAEGQSSASGSTTTSTNKSSDRFLLRVITPLGLLFEEPVSNVSLPGADGEIGVLPGHVSYNGILGTGLLKYDSLSTEAASGKNLLVVSGGFCSFSDGVLTILADQVDLPGQFDVTKISQLRAEAEEILKDANITETSRILGQSKLQRADALERLLAPGVH